MGEQPTTPAGQPPAPPHPQRVGLAWAWVVVFTLIASVVAGWALNKFGPIGAVVLWPLGWGGGVLARKITVEPVAAIGWGLVVGLFLALTVGEVTWCRYHLLKVDDWASAIAILPTVVSESTLTIVLAVILTVFGAQAAFGAAGRKLRYIAVYE